MHTLKIIAIAIGATLLFLDSIAVIIAALWGKPRRRGNNIDTWEIV